MRVRLPYGKTDFHKALWQIFQLASVYNLMIGLILTIVTTFVAFVTGKQNISQVFTNWCE